MSFCMTGDFPVTLNLRLILYACMKDCMAHVISLMLYHCTGERRAFHREVSGRVNFPKFQHSAKTLTSEGSSKSSDYGAQCLFKSLNDEMLSKVVKEGRGHSWDLIQSSRSLSGEGQWLWAMVGYRRN